MNVDLPETGCNILISSDSFYNYSDDLHTRQRFYIYEGAAHLQATDTNTYGYAYTGDCLHTGDLVYKPELEFYYNVFGSVSSFAIIALIAIFFVRKWWRVLR